MDKVYLILECPCADEGDFVLGAFTSREMAERERERLIEARAASDHASTTHSLEGLAAMHRRTLRVEEFVTDRLAAHADARPGQST